MARAPKTDGKPLDFQPRPGEPGPFSGYTLGAPYDEMFARDGTPRPEWVGLYNRLIGASDGSLRDLQANIDRTFMSQGVTFTVYGHEDATEKIIPTDCAQSSAVARPSRPSDCT